MKRLLALLTSAALAVGVAACGGSDDDATTATTSAAATTAQTDTAPAATTSTAAATTKTATEAKTDQGETTSTATGNGDGGTSTPTTGSFTDQLKTVGEEASSDDRDTIDAMVQEYYAAIAANDGDKACTLLSEQMQATIKKTFGQAKQLKGKDCGDILSLLFQNYPKQVRSKLTTIEVTQVRVDGDQAFAFYEMKGFPGGEIPMVREGDDWKVGALAGSAS